MKLKKLCFFSLTLVMIFSILMTPATASADWDDPKPTSIRKLNYKKRTVRSGQKFELKAYARPYDCDDDQLIWSTSNKKIVKILSRDRRDDDITLKAVKTGKAKITCRIRGTKKKKTCTVTVKKAAKSKSKKPNRIWVDDKYMDVDLYDVEDIEYRVLPRNASNKKVTFRSSNTKVATVNSRGYVYGKRIGKATITIQCKANSKIKTKVYVRVERDYDDDDYYDDDYDDDYDD